MPISSGAGGKPNSYFNPANALTRRASASSANHNSQGNPGYYYGSYGAEPAPTTVTMYDAGVAAPTPRAVQVMDISSSGPGVRVQQNGQATVTRDPSGRRCCPCPNRGRPEMRMPTMPKSKLGTAGGAVTRHGCCIFLIGLLALATVAGLIAGLYFLITQLTGVRMAREAFFLIPGRRTGDLMWVIYGTMTECEPVTTAGPTTRTTTVAAPTGPTPTTVATTTATTLISCASTTFRYVQVTLAGERASSPLLPLPVMAAALGLLHYNLIGWRVWDG